MVKKLLLGLLGILVAVAAWFFAQYRLTDNRVQDAKSLLVQGRYREMRQQLRNVLWLQPRHPEANVLMAQALTIDESLSLPGDFERNRELIEEALAHLALVPDDSPFGAMAHEKRAALEFNFQYRPSAALDDLARSIELDSRHASAYELRMRVYAMLGRPRYGYEDMWALYELLDDAERPLLLRRWFMYEFFPDTSLTETDRQMGFAGPDQMTNVLVANARLRAFKDAEPHSAIGYAAVGNWLLKQTDPTTAQELLNISLDQATDIDDCEYWFAIAVDTLEDLGTLDDAVELVNRWPAPQDSYDYWRAKAIVQHRVEEDPEAALESYGKALEYWPGPVDWSVRNMMAACLRELGRTDESIEMTERASDVEKQLRDDVLQPIRDALFTMDDPTELQRLVQFYDELDLPRERAAWQAVVDQLESQSQETADESSESAGDPPAE